MSNEYKEIRAKSEQVKRKLYNAESITGAELDTLRQYAQSNATAANIASYALGKKLVKEEE